MIDLERISFFGFCVDSEAIDRGVGTLMHLRQIKGSDTRTDLLQSDAIVKPIMDVFIIKIFRLRMSRRLEHRP